MDVEERMYAISAWLRWQDPGLKKGLRSIADAEKVYRHSFIAGEDPEDWDPQVLEDLLGYSPFVEQNDDEQDYLKLQGLVDAVS